MRDDTCGLFWDDTPPPKPPSAEKIKRIAPDRTWEAPDYLPNLDAALRFDVPLLTDYDLTLGLYNRERFVFDIECYPNYFLCAFKSLATGKVTYVERYDNDPQGLTIATILDAKKYHWLIHNFLVVSFNGNGYDVPISALALDGATNEQLQEATERLIIWGVQPYDLLRSLRVKKLQINHIDLIEVAPLQASLKIYGGRLHCKKIQDLPFKPGTYLSPQQAAIVRLYCCNDLDNTALLYESLREPIKLRESLTTEYGVDVRSKSDAQIAEAIIIAEVTKLSGMRPRPVEVQIGTVFQYHAPKFLRYQSDLLRHVLNVVTTCGFEVGNSGKCDLPPAVADLRITIANSTYQLGVGGLHSTEESCYHISDTIYVIKDKDVASYYPKLILNEGMTPPALGQYFIPVYTKLVNDRLAAKKRGDKVAAENRKIVVNGGFGKLGNVYSVLYAPNLLIQVTLTGQLSVLMLIERLELAGVRVVSSNTDGIVIKCRRDQQTLCDGVIKQWEKDTSLELEDTEYLGIFNRDVNNYLAIKPDLTTKGKGVFGNPWREGADSKELYSRLSKNPQNQICVEAVIGFLTKGTAPRETILRSNDIRKFVSVRNVKGGAVKDGVYLGRAVRWYYAKDAPGEIIYASNGHLVPRTDQGAKPLMDLPNEFPNDVNHDWYIEETNSMLAGIGYANSPGSADEIAA